MDPGECGVREERGVLLGAGCWQAERGFARAARREKGLGLAGCLGHGFGCWAAVRGRGLGRGEVGRGVRLVGPSAENELGSGMGRYGAWAKLGRVWASYWVWFFLFWVGLGFFSISFPIQTNSTKSI